MNSVKKLSDESKSDVAKWVWKNEWWVMSDELWVMSDGNWVIIFCCPNRLQICQSKHPLNVHVVLHKKIFFFLFFCFFFFPLSLVFIPSFIIQNITNWFAWHVQRSRTLMEMETGGWKMQKETLDIGHLPYSRSCLTALHQSSGEERW